MLEKCEIGVVLLVDETRYDELITVFQTTHSIKTPKSIISSLLHQSLRRSHGAASAANGAPALCPVGHDDSGPTPGQVGRMTPLGTVGEGATAVPYPAPRAFCMAKTE